MCTGKISAVLWLKVCIYLLRPAFSNGLPVCCIFLSCKSSLQYFRYEGARSDAWSEMRMNPLSSILLKDDPILCGPILFLGYLSLFYYLDLTFPLSFVSNSPPFYPFYFLTNSNSLDYDIFCAFKMLGTTFSYEQLQFP